MNTLHFQHTVRPILLLIAALLCSGLPAWAADSQCIRREAFEAVTFVLVDKSDPIANRESLDQTFLAISEMVAPGERLVVMTSSGRLADTALVMDLVRPKESIWESTLKIRARQKAFAACLGIAQTQLAEIKESTKTSAILETLSNASDFFKAVTDAPKRVVIYSDMVQNSQDLSFYGQALVNPDGSLAQAKKKRLIWDLHGVQVYAAGVGGNVTEERARAIKEFWGKYFEAAGASLKFYGPILLGQ